MTQTHNKNLELLGDEFTQQVLRELQADGLSPEAQEHVLRMMGDAILRRVALEILTVLPKEDHDEFEGLIGSGDFGRLHSFLVPRIPDLDRFIYDHATNAYEALKTRLHEQEQGVAQ